MLRRFFLLLFDAVHDLEYEDPSPTAESIASPALFEEGTP